MNQVKIKSVALYAGSEENRLRGISGKPVVFAAQSGKSYNLQLITEDGQRVSANQPKRESVVVDFVPTTVEYKSEQEALAAFVGKLKENNGLMFVVAVSEDGNSRVVFESQVDTYTPAEIVR
jgi:hypothetical protein